LELQQVRQLFKSIGNGFVGDHDLTAIFANAKFEINVLTSFAQQNILPEMLDGSGGNGDNRVYLGSLRFSLFPHSERCHMHPLFPRASGMTHDVIGSAIEVHKEKGPGLLESVQPIHKAQLLSYMKLLDIPLGLIINFNVTKLTDGVSRLILSGSNRD
jgi:hypothetical protein